MNARRIVAEWPALDQEARDFTAQVRRLCQLTVACRRWASITAGRPAGCPSGMPGCTCHARPHCGWVRDVPALSNIALALCGCGLSAFDYLHSCQAGGSNARVRRANRCDSHDPAA